MIQEIKSSLLDLRQNKPLVLCLTNYVTMDFMANCLLALGAAPIMSESINEIEELIHFSQALYINIGTLNTVFMKRALFAARIAHALQKPVILDPVGAGASKVRTSAAFELLPFVNIVRGNPSEIIALSGNNGSTKGVESAHPVEKAMEVGITLAQDLRKIFVISGPKDFITNGKHYLRLPFGSELMPLITGMGCTLTAVISAFVSNKKDYYQSAIHATAYFGLCGELANKQTLEPGSFRQVFINKLYQPDWDFFSKQIESAKLIFE